MEFKYFSKGKRGKVYVDENRKIAVKVSDKAKEEGKWMKKLNKYGIGPKFIKIEGDRVYYKFVEGIGIKDYLNKKKDKKVIKEVLKQCRKLDELKIDKKELVNPYKHILIGSKVVMIDFERCHYVKKAKNVTQFCEFLFRMKILNRDDINVIKEYKDDQNDKNYKKILKLI